MIAEAGAAVAHCPASNLKLASGFARITDLHAAGVTVSLGTDGAASANDLDPFLAMRLAAYPQAALHGAGAVTADEVVAMATINGAAALGIADRTGSLEPGKRADVVVLDAASPALTPSYDPVSTLAYAASRADVRWVVAGGRVAVDDRVAADGGRRCRCPSGAGISHRTCWRQPGRTRERPRRRPLRRP